MSLRRRRIDHLQPYELPSFEDTEDDPGASDPEGSDADEQRYQLNHHPTPEEAGKELSSYLWQLKHRGLLKASHVCVIAWWASLAGACGPVMDMGYRPDVSEAGTGRYAEHLDRLWRKDFADKYLLSVPGFSRAFAGRQSLSVPVHPPLELLKAEIRQTPNLAARVAEAINDHLLPPRFLEHPVYLSKPHGSPVHPVSLYIDGIPFTRHDGVISVTVTHLVTKVPHLVALLRKSQVCRCGCKGWCSIFILMTFLRWQFEALARGEHPVARHDGEPFGDEGAEAVRASLAGTPLGFAIAVVFIKSDLMEYATTLGFPAVSSLAHLCPFCCVTKHEIGDVSGLSALGVGFAVKTFAQYLAACSRCEIRVAVDRLQFVALRAALQDDRSDGGGRGRCLVRDFPDLGLRRGDRLEPTPEMQSTDAINVIDVSSPWPDGACLELLFWRRSGETLARRRNPLFAEHIGITPQSLVVDFLHCFSLGTCKVVLAFFTWAFIDANVWGVPDPTREGVVENIVKRLEARLFAWYDSQRAVGRRRISRVQQFKPSMIGNRDKPKLPLHGAETNAFARFSLDLVVEFWASIPLADRWHNGLHAAVQILDLYEETARGIDARQSQEFCRQTQLLIRAMRSVGITTSKPKEHFLAELAAGTVRNGPPQWQACWTEESLNGSIKIICKTVSQGASHQTFYAHVLNNFLEAYGLRAARGAAGV